MRHSEAPSRRDGGKKHKTPPCQELQTDLPIPRPVSQSLYLLSHPFSSHALYGRRGSSVSNENTSVMEILWDSITNRFYCTSEQQQKLFTTPVIPQWYLHFPKCNYGPWRHCTNAFIKSDANQLFDCIKQQQDVSPILSLATHNNAAKHRALARLTGVTGKPKSHSQRKWADKIWEMLSTTHCRLCGPAICSWRM
jgi:hypothetical protein